MNRVRSLGISFAVAAVVAGTAGTAAAQTSTGPSTTTTPSTTTPPSPSSAPSTTTQPSAPGRIQPSGDPIPGQYIVTLNGVAPTGVPGEAKALAAKHGGSVFHVYQHALQGFAVRMTAAQASALSEEPNVASVAEDGVVRPSTIQGPSPPPDWGLDRIDQPNRPLDNQYHYGVSGSGVTAFIIDTGIQGNLADFGGRVSFGVDEVGDGEPPLVDCQGHGTHVAGELGGTTYGVAKSVSLVEVRVLGCNGSGFDSSVIAAIDWVTGNANSPSVANMSLGGGQDPPLDDAIRASEDPVRTTSNDGQTTLNSAAIHVADGGFTSADIGARINDSLGSLPAGTFINSVTDAQDAVLSAKATTSSTHDVFTIGSGVEYAVAAGNGTNDNSVPANACGFSPSDLGGPNSATLTAAASDINDNQASFTNFGSCVDLYGPGVQITSDWPDNGVARCGPFTNVATCVLSGTSMATPHVAGTAALYLGANPTASPAAVKAAVTGDATPNVIVGATGGTPNKLDFTGPSPPSLTATVSGPTSVHLSWTAPTSNGGNPLTGYRVYRGTVSGNVSTPLASNLSPSTTTFDDTGLPCGQTFYYEVSAVNVVDPTDVRSVAASAAPCGASFRPLPPARILDTRSGLGAPQAPLGPGQTLTLQVAGQGGVPNVGPGTPATSVVMNVTATNETANSFVTVYPTGEPLPVVSNLNTAANTTIPNLVTVELGTGGQVSIYNFSGSTDVVADVFGWFDSNGTSGSDYHALSSPNRILDTRAGLGAPKAPLSPNQFLPLQVGGTGSGGQIVPADATAVVMNVTVTNATAPSFLTVYPADVPRPTASNLNFNAGVTIPNLVVVPLSPTGQADIYNFSGSTDVVADVAGYYGPDATSTYTAVSPARILDTRSFLGAGGPLGGPGTFNLTVQGNGGVPPTGATAVVMNTTVTNTTGPSWLTVYPAGAPQPLASNLNFVGGETIPNLVNVALGTGGALTIYNHNGSVDVVGDVAGYYR